MTSNIERILRVDYQSFFENIARRNEPFIASPSLTQSWQAVKDWRQGSGTDEDIRPDIRAIRSRYGHHLVQVANTKRRQYNEFERTERPFAEVADLWLAEDPDGDDLYVKDWHLALEVEDEGGSQRDIYETPEIFRDDWMTHHALSTSPRNDYRFTYIGPRGTFTPLHRDVYGSYSWSSNIVGRKRWWLIPPDIRHRFRKYPQGADQGEGEMLFDLRDAAEKALEGVMVVEQEAGETIFVPSGWYHQVENLDFCISINQNFANSATIANIYANLLESLERVQESISDVLPMLKQRLGEDTAFEFVHGGVTESIMLWEVEWVDEVQKVLEMDAGWGLKGFWEMVLYNLKTPAAPANLRPPDTYVASQVLPLVRDFQKRREWKVRRDLKTTVEEIADMIESM